MAEICLLYPYWCTQSKGLDLMIYILPFFRLFAKSAIIVVMLICVGIRSMSSMRPHRGERSVPIPRTEVTIPFPFHAQAFHSYSTHKGKCSICTKVIIPFLFHIPASLSYSTCNPARLWSMVFDSYHNPWCFIPIPCHGVGFLFHIPLFSMYHKLQCLIPIPRSITHDVLFHIPGSSGAAPIARTRTTPLSSSRV